MSGGSPSLFQASAPAKIILVGEHAVVYGQPAIAVPVSSLRASAQATPNSDHQGLYIEAEDLGQRLPVSVSDVILDHALVQTARLFLDFASQPAPNLTVHLSSQIPMASGLGSGAAVSTALVRVLAQAMNLRLTDDHLNSLIFEVEKLHHGTPSGIDNTVIVYERPVYFVRSQPIESVAIGAPLTLLIGDTGQGALTRVAVSDVRTLVESQPAEINPILDAVGDLVRQARTAIETGNAQSLGRLMTRNHHLLQQLTVSSPELDQLVDAALNAGALGAKLSGGGRGGNMIALVSPETRQQVADALTKAGAVRVFATTVA